MATRIYNRIKAALAEKGMTNIELAERIHKDERTISRYTTNSMQPPIEVLYEIAEVLQMDARDLLVPSSQVKKR